MGENKEAIQIYKARRILGGVYMITNTITGQYMLTNAIDLKGTLNLFNFARATGSCIHAKLKNDWDRLGGHAFVLQVLEEIEKIPEQIEEEFEKELEFREEFWRKKIYVKNANEY